MSNNVTDYNKETEETVLSFGKIPVEKIPDCMQNEALCLVIYVEHLTNGSIPRKPRMHGSEGEGYNNR